MYSTRPVTDLSNYEEVLKDVADDEPVILTENDIGRYIIISPKDFDFMVFARMKYAEELRKMNSPDVVN